MSQPKMLKRSNKPDIAYFYTPPSGEGTGFPQVVFLGGFKSDMGGTKAVYLEEQCKARGQGYVRLDYSGHGFSGGKFEEGTIGSWKDDALAVIDDLGLREVILVGSSMGGWISLIITMQRPDLVKAVIGIAAAPDFTDDMWFNRLNNDLRAEITLKGMVALPNDYSDEPYIITRALIIDGRENFVLDKPQPATLPIILLQGKKDEGVHWQTPEKIKSAFSNADIEIILIEDGDHRLSTPNNLELLDNKVRQLSGI